MENMEGTITWAGKVLQIGKSLGLDVFTTNCLVDLYHFCDKYNLRLSYCPQRSVPKQFQIDRADVGSGDAEAIYFELDRTPVMVGLLRLIDGQTTHLSQLEQRITLLEKQMLHANKAVQALTKSDSYQRYLRRFREKIPVFAEYGIELAIDEAAQEVIYQNGQYPPVRYPIDQAGYERAMRALNNAKIKYKTQQAADATVNATAAFETRLKQLAARATVIGNTLFQQRNMIYYDRPRRKNPQGGRWEIVFTRKDMLESQQKRPHNESTWYFSLSELDEIEQVISHDEEIYDKYFDED